MSGVLKTVVTNVAENVGIIMYQIGPGATPFTLIPLSIKFCDREYVNVVMAPLVLKYNWAWKDQEQKVPRIVKKGFITFVSNDRSCVDDSTSFFHVLQCSLSHEEERKDVCSECPLQLLFTDIFDVFLDLLNACIVHLLRRTVKVLEALKLLQKRHPTFRAGIGDKSLYNNLKNISFVEFEDAVDLISFEVIKRKDDTHYRQLICERMFNDPKYVDLPWPSCL